MERVTSAGIAALIGFGVVAGAAAYAASVDKDLEGIKKKIESEKQGISQVKKKEGSVLNALEQIEQELQRKNAELKRANSKLNAVLVDLQSKESEAERIHVSLEERRSLLARRAAALYRWQRAGSPMVILSGAGSLGDLQQRKYYLEKTLAFDRELITSLSHGAAEHERVARELARKKEDADSHRRALAQARESYEKEAEKKRQLLASLRNEKETRLRALKELQQAALRLQKMMEEIARRSAGRPQETAPGTGLGALRGKLEWPVKGAVTSGFGKTKHKEFAAEVFRKGIDIEAPVGEEIRAVEKGKVVFADRFSGYGKMLILDHGERYYTIYAHLSEFLKKNGDTVKRGEPIALVGDSDLLAGSGLYFEMRKDGKSIDPLPYLKRQ